MDGEDASATEFQERLDMLKAIGDPIFFRYLRMTGVPYMSINWTEFSIPLLECCVTEVGIILSKVLHTDFFYVD